MKDGFIKAAAATPDIRVADCEYNCNNIMDITKKCAENGVKLIVFPELCITGYTCQDLFLQDTLLDEALKGLSRLVQATEGTDILCMAGLPFMMCGRLYNVAAVYQNGELLALIPKMNIPNYSEFYELRHFEAGCEETVEVCVKGFDYTVPFGSKVLFECEQVPELIIGAEICEDVWTPVPPSCAHALAGAVIICNLSASDEITGKDLYRKQLVSNQSARLIAG